MIEATVLPVVLSATPLGTEPVCFWEQSADTYPTIMPNRDSSASSPVMVITFTKEKELDQRQHDLYGELDTDFLLNTAFGETVRVECKRIGAAYVSAITAAAASAITFTGEGASLSLPGSLSRTVSVVTRTEDDSLSADAFEVNANPLFRRLSERLLGRCPQYSIDLPMLRSKVADLQRAFSAWPGSYNQLMLAGSLDYCRSVLSKMQKIECAPNDVFQSIQNYYHQCLSIYRQNKDVQSTLRRLHLQSMEDRFDLLQEVCAEHGIYSRLDDLDLADIPRD